MKFGIVFPNMDLPTDGCAVRRFLVGIDRLGYDHLLTYDHVVGVDRAEHVAWDGALDLDDAIHEPLTLLAFAAALTSLELVTGVLVLPQRQTALVAKQVAELDVLSGGRVRLGIGLGWNEQEYTALAQDFRGRAGRIEGQMRVLRLLWTQRSARATIGGETLDGVGLHPRPVQRPVPLWLAAGATKTALERVGRLADGWIPRGGPGAELNESLAIVARAAEAAGRDPGGIGMEGRIDVDPSTVDEAVERAMRWAEAGATHLSFNVMGRGLAGPDDMLDLLGELRSSLAARFGPPRARQATLDNR